MRYLILRRVAVSVPLLFIVSFVTFALVSLTPGDAASTMLGPGATDEQLAELRERMGLNQPMLVQYAIWAGAAVQGDFGSSLLTGQSVLQALSQHLWPTLSLALLTLVVSGVGGVWVGAWSAARGGRVAQLVDSLSFVGMAIPGFLLGIFLILVFALQLPLFPVSGYVQLSTSPGEWLRSLVLPVTALAIGGLGIVAKQSRAAMEDVLSREFVAVFRANGYSRFSIIYWHALRAAGVQIQSVVGVMFVGLLSGAVLVEAVFAIPGLGSLAVQATARADIPVILGVTVLFTLLVVVANLLLDIAFMLVNPKVARR